MNLHFLEPFLSTLVRKKRTRFHAACIAALGLALASAISLNAKPQSVFKPQPVAGNQFSGTPVQATAAAVVNFSELANAQVPAAPEAEANALGLSPLNPPGPVREQPRDYVVGPPQAPPQDQAFPLVASPAPTFSFAGLDDIADTFTALVWTPPDTDGAVGLNHVMSGLNNDYRIWNKANAATLSTVGTYSFWSMVGGTNFFDPKTLYDPNNNRWIVVILSDASSTNSSIDIGVSQTADPTGAYYLFRVKASTGSDWVDFPNVGFNRNWVAVNVNLLKISDNSSLGAKMLVVDYGQLRAGTLSSVFMTTGPSFCSSPAATYSPTENTLYVMKHLSGPAGTYRVDTITGTPGAPVYTVGATKTRGTTTWAEPESSSTVNNILPQAAPLAGVSSCGATPCKLETQDSEIRSSPVVRGGFLYYSQTIGLPTAGLTHTAVQWTRLDAGGGATTGNFLEGGRVEDATATASNGGKWYNYPHIAVNQFGDIILGFSQFSSTQYPSAGYTYHHRNDAAGSMQDPVIYQAGVDYYRKDFNGSGRFRWGDYSKAQVDPSNDADLWVLQEYSKARVGSDDSATTNTSRWGTWWAKIGCVLSCPADFSQGNDPGACGAVVNFPAAGTSGPCGPVSYTPPSGSFLPVGTSVVMAADTTGASCSFTVTVNDVEPPKLNCPGALTECNDPGLCSAVVKLPVTATDNCPGVTLICNPPSGSVFPVGTTLVSCTAMDASRNTVTCSFPVTVKDCEPPTVACQQGPNPSGRHVPSAGSNPHSGQNPDGFYQVFAHDNCDPNPSIYVADSKSSFVAGPFHNGDDLKITQSPGAKPRQEPGPGAIVAHLHLKGDALLFAVDAVGNASPPVSCLVPPPPK